MRHRSVRTTMWLVFAALLVVGGLSMGVSLWTIRAQQHDALIINLASRQRMLSQKAAKEAWMGLYQGKRSRSLAQVHAVTHEFETGLRALLNGGQFTYAGRTVTVPSANDPAFRAALEEVQTTNESFQQAAHTVFESEPASPAFGQSVAELGRLSNAILEDMDAAVRTYQAASEARVARLRWMQLVLFLIGGAMLVLGAWLVLTEHQVLQQAEARYRGLFDGVPVGLYRSTPTGELVDVNLALVDMLGYPDREALLEVDAADLYMDPEDRTRWQAEMEREGTVRNFEMRFRRLDATIIWVQDTARTVRDEQGQIVYYEGSLEDVTERKQAEEALRESEARFRAVFEGATIGVALTDLEGRLLNSNAALQEMHGYSEEELRGMPFAELTHPDDVAADRGLFEELVAGQRDHYRIEKRYIRKDGRAVWGRLTVSLIRDASDEPQFVIAMVEDITERKQAEQAKQRLQERLQRQHEALIRLSTHPVLAEGRLEEALPAITEAVAKALEVERVNIWRLSPDGCQLHCLEALEHSSGKHSAGYRIRVDEHPNYLAALEDGLVVDAVDVTRDPRTSGLTAEYWEPLGISSAIDAPIRLHGEVVGVVCHEQVGPSRTWTSDEITFASQVADLVAQGFLNADVRRRAAHLEALNAIIAAAAAATDLSDLLETVLDHTLRALGLESGIIWLQDSLALQGMPPGMGQALREVVTAISQGTPDSSVEEDWLAGDDPLWAMSQMVGRLGIRDTLTVPLLADGGCVGGLIVAAQESRSWTPEEVDLVEAVGRQLGAAAERVRLFQESQAHAERMGRLAALGEALNRSFTAPDVVAAIGQGGMALSNADRAAVFLRHPDDSVTCPWSHGLSPAYVEQATAQARELPGGRLLEQVEPVLVPDVHGLPGSSPLHGLAKKEGYRAVGMWPLVYEGEVVAAVGCYHNIPYNWTPDEHEVMQAFCRQAAVALENARLYENLEDTYVETILALSNAMDARDAYTGSHSQQLANWAMATAQELGCNEDQIEAIRWGALLHDIGKIGVPDRILQKPGELGEHEWEVIKRHPAIGADIVAPVKQLADVVPIIRSHQEWWDGSGYPDGLQGEAIPRGARVLAVVDAYGAITDDRPYEKARSHEEAVAELKRCAGTQFDPQVVEAFLQVLERDVDITGGGGGEALPGPLVARLPAEFVSKIEGGLQELEETAYWLELLIESGIVPEARLTDLCNEAEELTAIFVSSAKTAKK